MSFSSLPMAVPEFVCESGSICSARFIRSSVCVCVGGGGGGGGAAAVISHSTHGESSLKASTRYTQPSNSLQNGLLRVCVS